MSSPAIDATEIAGFDYLKLENFLPDEHKALVQDVRVRLAETDGEDSVHVFGEEAAHA